MTSFDFGTLNRSVQMQEEQHRTEEVQNTKNKVPATDLASLFGDLPVGGSLSEDIMLRNAQARILARNDREVSLLISLSRKILPISNSNHVHCLLFFDAMFA